MTSMQRKQIIEGLQQTEQFIEREEGRNESLRPVDVQKTLDFYREHRVKLQQMLELA